MFLEIPAITAIIFLIVSPVMAWFFYPHPQKVCAEYFHSDAVFTGKVISEKIVIDPEDPEGIAGWRYRIKVSQVFRGPQKNIIIVYTENASTRFTLKVGCEYLLFAWEEDKRLWIGDTGGNSDLLSKCKKKIQEIKQISKAKDGEIEGRISEGAGGKGVKEIKVKIEGEGKSFYCLTDTDGWFHARVKPGKYRAIAEEATPFDFSYDDPTGFVVEKGGCAELQFVKY